MAEGREATSDSDLAITLVRSIANERFRKWVATKGVLGCDKEVREAFDVGLALGFEIAALGGTEVKKRGLRRKRD